MEQAIRYMLDTIRIWTEHLTPGDYVTITEQLQTRVGLSPTGETTFTLYTAPLAAPVTGAIVKVQVTTAKWIRRPGEKAPYKVDGINSLSIQGSVTKSMHGHNVYGGPREPQEALQWMVNLVSLMLDVELPELDHWFVDRLDISESFDLGSLDNVRGWIRSKSLVVYPRREIEWFGDSGFRAPGTTTTIKAYAKGPEFHREGGYKALITSHGAATAFEVSRVAERTLRAEVEIKEPLLAKQPNNARADGITQEWIEGVYEDEWRKLLRPIDSDSRMVHTAVEVYSRLQATYDDTTKCLNLYLVWCLLAVRGETFYRSQVGSSTWRRQRTALENAYISWHDTNVLTIDGPESLQQFSPLLNAPQRITEILSLSA